MDTNQKTQEATEKLRLLADDFDQLVEAIRSALKEEQSSIRDVASSNPYMNVQEAARYMTCSNRRIYDLKEGGRLRFVKDGRRLLTRRSWIDEYLNGES